MVGVPSIVEAFMQRFLLPPPCEHLPPIFEPAGRQVLSEPRELTKTRPTSFRARCRTPIARGAQTTSAPSTIKATATTTTARAIPPHLPTTRLRGTAAGPESTTNTTETMTGQAMRHTMGAVTGVVELAVEEVAARARKQRPGEVSEGVVERGPEAQAAARKAQYHPKAARQRLHLSRIGSGA